MEYNELRMLFHMLAASFLTGKTYSDYCEQFEDAIPLKNSKGVPIKGNKSLKAFTMECKVKVDKHLKMLEGFLNRQPEALKMSLEEVDRLESIMSSLLMLSPKGQQRVKGLIDKLKDDEYELQFWEDYNNEVANHELQ